MVINVLNGVLGDDNEHGDEDIDENKTIVCVGFGKKILQFCLIYTAGALYSLQSKGYPVLSPPPLCSKKT